MYYRMSGNTTPFIGAAPAPLGPGRAEKRGYDLQPADLVLFANGECYQILTIADRAGACVRGLCEIADPRRCRLPTSGRLIPFRFNNEAAYTTLQREGGAA
jgi:hypothetical protein